MKTFVTILFVLASFATKAQRVDSIYFNLYTDSLKKGVYNYINVDGKLENKSFYPLMASEVVFTSSFGRWDGNSLIIDSAYQQDSVVITATLKANPRVTRSVTIYMKKSTFEGEIKTQEELLEEWRNRKKKSG